MFQGEIRREVSKQNYVSKTLNFIAVVVNTKGCGRKSYLWCDKVINNQEQTIENVMSFRVFPTKSKILNYLAIITRTWFSNEKLIISWFLRTILINILLVTYHLLFLCSPNKLPNRWNSQNSSALHSKSCNSHYMVDLLFSWRVIISYSLSKKSHNNKWLFFVKTLSNEDPLKFESLLTFFALLLE